MHVRYAFYKLSYIPSMELVLRSSLDLSAWISVTTNCENAEVNTISATLCLTLST